MPRPSLPPTPGASTEIQGRDGSSLSANDKKFDIGPPAIAPKLSNRASPPETGSRSAVNTNFTLPPPPTRSRTIIQMKPKSQPCEDMSGASLSRSSKASSKKAVGGSNMGSGGGKKQPSSTSVAGKKIARKTAHSVIERRRRSKMNEEFATLKGMIPACTDQEMHKLAILQASIDYLRYLEKCITDLKAANNSLSTPLLQAQAPPLRLSTTSLDDNDIDEDGDEDDEDIVMRDTPSNEVNSPPCSNDNLHNSPQSIPPSPALKIQSHHQISSHASSASTLPSPVFGPRGNHYRGSKSYSSISASNSPIVMSAYERDEEATAALLMLNQDRRNPSGGRGMSVKDLLSS